MQGEMHKNIAVCFSGGLDSTTVALVMGRRYGGSVHLVTMQHRFGHILPGLAKRHVRDLERLLGKERVTHHYAHISAAFKDVVLASLLRDYRTHRSQFIVCMGCNLAMDAHLIAYCLEHRVPAVFFGFTPKGSGYAVMSFPETSRERRALYGSFGLLYRIPLMEWHMEKPEERQLLRDHGVWPGFNFRKIAMGVQPLCLLGVAMHASDILFDRHPQYDRDQVVAFIREKTRITADLVKALLEARGIDLDERVALMRELNADEWSRYGPDAPALDVQSERDDTAAHAGIASIAARSFPTTVPLRVTGTLSRDGRALEAAHPSRPLAREDETVA